MTDQKSRKRLMKWFRSILIACGIFFTLCILLAFTTLPFWMYYGLGTYGATYRFKPATIVLLGGGGMPSEQNLMRCYTASSLAIKYPESRVIIALTKDSADKLYGSDVWQMKQELVQRGIDSSRIILETTGKNTHEQVRNIVEVLSGKNEPVLIVTSPEHMYRSLGAFRKAGATIVGGEAAFEKALSADLKTGAKKSGANKKSPDSELQLRYQFWNHLKYQVMCYREYVAIAYYKIRGWI